MKKIFLTALLVAGVLFGSYAVAENNPVDAPAETKTVTLHEKISVTAAAAGNAAVEESAASPAAANVADVDWANAPRFNNYKSLVDYLNRNRKNLQTYLPVLLTDGFAPDINELVRLAPIWFLSSTNYGSANGTTKMLYEITNYPGERVAWAYTHGNTSFLSPEERNLYNAAVSIVSEAKRRSDKILRQELYIHDVITEKASYYTENPQPTKARFQSAIGALLDGRANCQGYADAFYMLGTMCGINVDKINGYANDEFHVWNTLDFGDGRSYFVDVTWDDASFTFADSGEYTNYIYFNAPVAVMTTHRWFTDYVPKNMQQNPDGRYFYYTREFTNSNGKFFGAHSNSATEALDYIAYRIARQGWRMSWVCTPNYDAKYTNANAAVNYLTQNVLPNRYGWSGNIKLNVNTRGNFMFFTVDATAK